MTLKDLMEHSDKRDDIIEKKIDHVDNFIHNGLSDKIIKGITDYLNEQTVRRVKLFFKILITAVIATIASGVVKLMFF